MVISLVVSSDGRWIRRRLLGVASCSMLDSGSDEVGRGVTLIDVYGRMISERVSGLVHSINTMNIDIKIPKFENELKMYPLDFLDRLDKYFTFRKCSEFEKLLIIENSIEGRGKIWYNANRCNFISYVTFKEAFEKQFYSVPMQAKIQSQWSARRFDSRKEYCSSGSVFFNEE
ncbi:hypothetical protein KPH14_001315 [Odynerus spinipes]|uniref:Uncharacterized protein n=1 Tax=Odynerus spinipes TaxID=1348599 RepID=A0AAD9RGP8_9HYME|nr:hypothetical protein KPH14_001315 [Odynerus spinipes]